MPPTSSDPLASPFHPQPLPSSIPRRCLPHPLPSSPCFLRSQTRPASSVSKRRRPPPFSDAAILLHSQTSPASSVPRLIPPSKPAWIYKDHKGDAEFLNKPIVHYYEMVIIFGNSLATGKYAKESSNPLATEVNEIDDDDDAGNDSVGATKDDSESSASKPKRAKTVVSEDEGLPATFRAVGERLAIAIEKDSRTDNDLPESLWENMKDLPAIEEAHLSHYYAYLVENVRITRTFNTLNLSNKLVWISRYISTHFPGWSVLSCVHLCLVMIQDYGLCSRRCEPIMNYGLIICAWLWSKIIDYIVDVNLRKYNMN